MSRVVKKFPLSPKMQWSHMRMVLARGRHNPTHLPDVKATLADPRVPLKVKLYRARKWPAKCLARTGGGR